MSHEIFGCPVFYPVTLNKDAPHSWWRRDVGIAPRTCGSRCRNSPSAIDLGTCSHVCVLLSQIALERWSLALLHSGHPIHVAEVAKHSGTGPLRQREPINPFTLY